MATVQQNLLKPSRGNFNYGSKDLQEPSAEDTECISRPLKVIKSTPFSVFVLPSADKLTDFINI